jgi:glutamyl-tRNA reductase
MMLVVVGANFRTAGLELRERLAFSRERLVPALTELASRFACETAILNTCNRVEIYLARTEGDELPGAEGVAEFLAQFHGLPEAKVRPALYAHRGAEAVRHLFRVASGLDSMVLGETQIAGQVKDAYQQAQIAGTTGPILHALFQHARIVTRRVRAETGLTQGKVSVSSLAVDYLTQVFDHFQDKTVLVIGAGKMGELTLKQLRRLRPGRILVTNRSPDKARQVAACCGGIPMPFEQLDSGLAAADIILSTTGAPEPIVTLERFKRLVPQRQGRPVAILDIAVPRDFDPYIIHLDCVELLLNIDDLQALRERVLQSRLKHVAAAEAIVRAETERFLEQRWQRRAGSAIARWHQDWDAIRQEVQEECFRRLNGKLAPEDLAIIEGAFRLLQNKLMHAPLTVLRQEAQREGGGRLLEALYKLFRLE